MPHMDINPIELIDAIPLVLIGLFVLVIGWVIWNTTSDMPDDQAPPER